MTKLRCTEREEVLTDCCRTDCFTSLEGSCVSRRNISTSTPRRMSTLTHLEMSHRDSAHALRTRYTSSLLRRTKAGINRLELNNACIMIFRNKNSKMCTATHSKSSCSPPTLQILWKFRAVDLRTRNIGSSASETTSGITNCLHKS